MLRELRACKAVIGERGLDHVVRDLLKRQYPEMFNSNENSQKGKKPSTDPPLVVVELFADRFNFLYTHWAKFARNRFLLVFAAPDVGAIALDFHV